MLKLLLNTAHRGNLSHEMSSEIIQNSNDAKYTKNDASDATEEDIVDPWNVLGKSETGVDYDKLIGESTNSTFYTRNVLRRQLGLGVRRSTTS